MTATITPTTCLGMVTSNPSMTQRAATLNLGPCSTTDPCTATPTATTGAGGPVVMMLLGALTTG